MWNRGELKHTTRWVILSRTMRWWPWKWMTNIISSQGFMHFVMKIRWYRFDVRLSLPDVQTLNPISMFKPSTLYLIHSNYKLPSHFFNIFHLHFCKNIIGYHYQIWWSKLLGPTNSLAWASTVQQLGHGNLNFLQADHTLHLIGPLPYLHAILQSCNHDKKNKRYRKIPSRRDKGWIKDQP